MSLIFFRGDQVLAFRISKKYPICPGDWEWFTLGFRTLEESGLRFEKITSQYLLEIGKRLLGRLSGKIDLSTVKEIRPIAEPFVWDDEKFSLTYRIFPIIVEVSRDFSLQIYPDIDLFRKFSDLQWFRLEEIRALNNAYLNDFLKYLKEHSSWPTGTMEK